MAYSTRTYTPSGSTTTFALTTSGGSPIGYIQESDIKVTVNGTVYTNAASGTSTYQISGSSTVEQPNGGNVVLNAGVTGTVILERTTAIQSATVTYTAGSTLTASDLNNADNQIRFGLQEFSDDYAALLGTGNLTTLGSFLGGSDTWVSNDAKAATTAAIDGQIDTKATAKVKDDIIATAPVSIADDSPSAGKITISVDAELTELATMPIATAQSLADLTSTEVQILDGATLSTAELNYVDGVTSAVQTQIDGKQPLDGELTELATMASGTASALADLTQAEVEILDGATLTTTELNYVDGVTSNVQTQLDAKQTLDAELTELATMSTGTSEALADLTQTEVQILDDATVTTAELNVLDGIPGTLTATELGYVDGVTSSIQTQLGAKQPLDADLTTLAGMQGATASILAGGTALTSTLTELNQIDGKTIGETSLTTNSNTAIPTSKAVADHVSGSVTALGGFVAIATEAAFPATASMPASGVVVSISDAGGVVVNGSGASTTGRTTDGSPATVTINSFPSSLYSETLAAGVGLQVLSTGSSNTYTYHKVLAAETDVKQLSDDINDFNARYRTDTSDPGSNNDEGDLFFNKTSNTMKVYDGSAWGEVTSTGDFKFLFLCPTGGSGAPTIDGSIDTYDLRETTNSGTGASVTNAAQLVVSVNGVIQQPNAGTSTSGLDGFVMTDANTIKFAANLQTGDDVFVIQIGSAVTLNAPANNTVSTDVLQNLAVTNGKIADDTIAEVKLDISNAPADGKYLQYKDSSDKLTWSTVSTTPTTTRGDIIYRAASADARLAKGTSGQYLKIGANDPEWADVVADLVNDTSPQLGGDLDTNSFEISLDDSHKVKFGDSSDLGIYHDGTDSIISNLSGETRIQCANIFKVTNYGNSETYIKGGLNAQVELYYDNSKKFETTSNGVKVTGTLEGQTDSATSTHTLPVTVNSWGWRFYQNSSSSPYGLEIKYSGMTRDDSVGEFLNCLDTTAVRFKVSSDGDVWNHDDSYSGSDQTLKENIVDASSKLEDVKKLKVRNFNWKADKFPEKSKKKMLGFIAQEVEEVFPSLIKEYNITGDNDNPVMKKAIKQAWAPILVKALQEAVAKIEVLETKVAALEAV